MDKFFKEFFTCPHCGSPRVEVERLREYVESGMKYCGRCGKKIASALAEALAISESD